MIDINHTITYSGTQTTKRYLQDRWSVDINGQQFDYGTGEGLRKSGLPVTPKLVDVLHALILESEAESQNFYEFCSDYGYDDDSIKAFDVYRACLDNAQKLRKALGRDYASIVGYIRSLEL